MKVKSNGMEIEVEVFGERGPAMVLIMGLGSQLIQWPDDFCAALSDAGYRVIRFDNRDIGLSTHLDHLGVPDVRKVMARGTMGLPIKAPYSLDDMADDTAGLSEALGFGRDAHIVGVSMGGMIAQTLAIRHPDRVRSLVSIMSTTGSRRHALARPRALKALMAPLPPTREGRVENFVDLFRILNGPVFPFDEDYARDLASRSYERSHHPQGFVRQLAAIAASGNRQEALGGVKAPTTVIHGTLDPLVPPSGGKATARAIPNARLQWVEGMGHAMPRPVWPILIEAIDHNARRSPL